MTTDRVAPLLFTAALCLAAPFPAEAAPRDQVKQPAKATTPAVTAPVKRQLRRRPMKLTDAEATTVPEILVAAGVPTTLAFKVPIQPQSVLVADNSGVFPEKTRANEKSVLLTPTADIPEGSIATLQVTLADGTILPFQLHSSPTEADLQVDIEVALETTAAPESAKALKTSLEQLRTQLDECQQGSAAAGVQKIASLISSQDMSQPPLFQRYNIHKLDKQNRLLVEARQAYHLFGYTYVVLTVENRDDKVWVLKDAGVSLMGASGTEDLKVAAVHAELPALNADETMKVVIAFAPPAHTAANQRYVISLTEQNGRRHVRLDDVSL